MLRPPDLRRRSCRFELDQRLVAPQNKSGCGGWDRTLCFYSESNPQLSDHSARSLVSKLTELRQTTVILYLSTILNL
jgi:hypothetical protein